MDLFSIYSEQRRVVVDYEWCFCFQLNPYLWHNMLILKMQSDLSQRSLRFVMLLSFLQDWFVITGFVFLLLAFNRLTYLSQS